jgi:hypothetical protein
MLEVLLAISARKGDDFVAGLAWFRWD